MKTFKSITNNCFSGNHQSSQISKSIFFLILSMAMNSAVFSQTYTVNGTAVNFGNGLVRMTSYVPQAPLNPGDWQTSSAWCTTKFNLNTTFDMTFDLFFGCESGPDGGDGITFTFQNQGSTALGAGGGFLGLGGIIPAISIEFDTYNGTPWGGSNELAADHIAIDRNGDVNNTTSVFAGTSGNTTVQQTLGGRDLENCAANVNNYYTIRIVWDPVAKQLKLYEEGVLTLTYTEDIVNTIFGGNSMVYWGFTSATGSASNEQWIAPAGTIIPWQCSYATSCCTTYTVTPVGSSTICAAPVAYSLSSAYSSYRWSNGTTTSTASIAAAGTYTINVLQNQAGSMCPGSATFTVTANCPAPVEMVSFTADKKDSEAQLNWTTASESNNDFFEIYHSTDGINFGLLGKVNGIGTTSEITNYSFNHSQPASGNNYYRLVQVDIDGTQHDCGIATVSFDSMHIQVYPNPSFSNFKVDVSGNENASVSLSDMAGKEIFSMKGRTFLLGDELPRGSYMLKVISEKEVKTVQLLKEE